MSSEGFKGFQPAKIALQEQAPESVSFLKELEGITPPIANTLRDSFTPEEQIEIGAHIFSRVSPNLLKFIEGEENASAVTEKVRAMLATTNSDTRRGLAKEIVATLERLSD